MENSVPKVEEIATQLDHSIASLKKITSDLTRLRDRLLQVEKQDLLPPFQESALLEIVEVIQEHQNSDLLWWHNIENPQREQRTDTYTFTFSGWVLGKNSPAVTIEIISDDGRIIKHIPVGVSRPDVAKDYPHVVGADKSGFHAVVILPTIGKLTVEAVLVDEVRVSLGVVLVEQKQSTPSICAGARKTAQYSLVVLDHIFPLSLSAFTLAEYNAYLENFPKAAVYSTGLNFIALGETKSFSEVLGDYLTYYPKFKNRVFKFNPYCLKGAKFVYTLFLSQIFHFIDLIDYYNIPFAFTLYSGGGFALNDHMSDQSLRRVCSSKNFRKVIVCQSVIKEYLLKNNFCKQEQIVMVEGVLLPWQALTQQKVSKQYYKKDKNTFDICFVAHKYTMRGVSKGYDLFVEVAKVLAKKYGDIRFHVVGGWDEHTIDVSDIQDKIFFYGKKQTDWFPQFHASMDIILAPKLPFSYLPGVFDGAPVGSCVEAGLCGVAVFFTDQLNQNILYKDREEVVVIPRNEEEVYAKLKSNQLWFDKGDNTEIKKIDVLKISNIIEKYYHHPDDLYLLAECGQKAFEKMAKNQIPLRLKVLRELLEQQE
ncbi:MAG: hypothetical protein MGF17_10360 [Trichodesmium sp. MAG_R04]|nr:hypothetical protein [Trichodesmium sp. MAG_R04]